MTSSTVKDSVQSVSSGSLSAYAIATGLVAVAALIEWCLQFVAEGVMPFATFFPAVLFATLIGGAGPGAFAVCLSFIIGWWALLPVRMSFQLLGLSEQINLILYCLAALSLVWGGERYRRLAGKLADEEKNKNQTGGEADGGITKMR
jgi:K+-sensing histidine kinase KdpD